MTAVSNDRLRAALQNAGIDAEQLADAVGVDYKTVQRWISGRLPRGRHRAAVAAALGVTERELWPEAAVEPKDGGGRMELVGAFARSDDVLAPDWKTAITEAGERIDLLDYTLIHILGASGMPEVLAAKAKAGCQIRLLISYATRARLAEDIPLDLPYDEDPPAAMVEIARSRAIINQLLQLENVQARKFAAPRFNTIVRCDQRMLVTLHLWGTSSQQAPLIHLRQLDHPGLFDQFERHYEHIWQHASHAIQPEPEGDRFPDPDKSELFEQFVFDDPPPEDYEP
jgi:transcriptional regulator with XRE-family HTH domain